MANGILNPDLLTSDTIQILTDSARIMSENLRTIITAEMLLLALVQQQGTVASKLLARIAKEENADTTKLMQQARLAAEQVVDQSGNLDYLTISGARITLGRQSIIAIDDALSFAQSNNEVRVDTHHLLYALADSSISTSGILRRNKFTGAKIAKLLGDMSYKAGNNDTNSIFISYRRTDSIHVCGRIYDRLIGVFGSKRIFRDLDNIPLGADFRQVVEKAIGECTIALIIIGKGWLNASDEQGRIRLENPADFVRVEIETSLRNGLVTIPVLVDDASIPRADQLPQSISSLAFRNAITIRSDPHFHVDVNRLVEGIRKIPPRPNIIPQ